MGEPSVLYSESPLLHHHTKGQQWDELTPIGKGRGGGSRRGEVGVSSRVHQPRPDLAPGARGSLVHLSLLLLLG